MAEEKKPWYEGWRKFLMGVACIGAGVYVVSVGHVTEGVALIGTGVGLFTAGNVMEHKIKNGEK